MVLPKYGLTKKKHKKTKINKQQNASEELRSVVRSGSYFHLHNTFGEISQNFLTKRFQKINLGREMWIVARHEKTDDYLVKTTFDQHLRQQTVVERSLDESAYHYIIEEPIGCMARTLQRARVSRIPTFDTTNQMWFAFLLPRKARAFWWNRRKWSKWSLSKISYRCHCGDEKLLLLLL